MLPAKAQRGSPTGGGNFYIFKNAKPEERKAALTFIRWVTEPARAAEWSIKSGYVAVKPSAYDTEAMATYAKGFPQALVARDQLQHAVPELSVHENGRIYKLMNDTVQAALTGTQTPEAALDAAQRQADRLLARYR
jgi:sn-glycerol 3-phosphate transport system substrate-binding protein